VQGLTQLSDERRAIPDQRNLVPTQQSQLFDQWILWGQLLPVHPIKPEGVGQAPGIHPDGDLTINYLDTKGLPLTPDHLSAATALVARMIGTSAQEDKQMLRQAQIAKYLNLLYEDAFQDWQKKRHGFQTKPGLYKVKGRSPREVDTWIEAAKKGEVDAALSFAFGESPLCTQFMRKKLDAAKRGLKAAVAVMESCKYAVAGKAVCCPHCGGETFDQSSVLLNTRGLTLLNLDWANKSATTLICRDCGRVEWFLHAPEKQIE
jgi:hypothetical protein